MQKTNNELLKERIVQNYVAFKVETLEMDEGNIYDMAKRIVAVEDTYYQMVTYEYLDEDEAGYLLNFYNPLEMIADFLTEIVNDQIVEINSALFDLFEKDDHEEKYITIMLAEKLKEKYGADANMEIALLSELIEAGNEYLRLRKFISRSDDEGVGYCHG